MRRLQISCDVCTCFVGYFYSTKQCWIIITVVFYFYFIFLRGGGGGGGVVVKRRAIKAENKYGKTAGNKGTYRQIFEGNKYPTGRPSAIYR